MSITAVAIIAASLFTGAAIGIREQRKRGIRPIATDDIDSCITVYASEQTCECMDEHLLDVQPDQRGFPTCTNCGRRRV